MIGQVDARRLKKGGGSRRSKLFLLLLPAAGLLIYFRQWRSDLIVKRNVLLSIERKCYAEYYAEYGNQAQVLTPGDQHLTETSDACCKACLRQSSCNVWVWCGDERGCGEGRRRGECWLKQADMGLVMDTEMGRANSPGVQWVSGTVQSEFQRQTHIARLLRQEEERLQRMRQLRDDPDLPLVWMDVSIKGKPAGRIEMVLFSRESPLAAESMRRLCTGEMGVAPAGHEGAGKPYSLKGANFYRIIDGFIDQTGAPTDSPLGGDFRDEPGGLALKHDMEGLLSLANSGPNTNCAHFSIVMGPAPHLNGNYGIFGAVTNGIQVAHEINKLSKGAPNNELLDSHDAVITDVGQIRRGKPFNTALLKGNVFFPPKPAEPNS